MASQFDWFLARPCLLTGALSGRPASGTPSYPGWKWQFSGQIELSCRTGESLQRDS